jgi:hypothetical protein
MRPVLFAYSESFCSCKRDRNKHTPSRDSPSLWHHQTSMQLGFNLFSFSDYYVFRVLTFTFLSFYPTVFDMFSDIIRPTCNSDSTFFQSLITMYFTVSSFYIFHFTFIAYLSLFSVILRSWLYHIFLVQTVSVRRLCPHPQPYSSETASTEGTERLYVITSPIFLKFQTEFSG